MSFLTEYFDEYRQHPIRKTKMCRPEHRWAELPGNWSTTSGSDQDVETQWSDEETEAFIKKTMKSLRGQSSYFNHYCAHHDQDLKTRPFVARKKPRIPCHGVSSAAQEQEPAKPPPKLAIKDTELMKLAKELYERDLDQPPMKPLNTHARILSYVRPCLYLTGLSDYQGGIGRLAYELIRDSRIPRYVAHNGCRPRWGIPPDGTRQPELDVAPYDGERLF